MYLSQEKKGGNQAQKPNSEKDNVVTKEKEFVYGIDRLNLDDFAAELESDSEWLLVQCREGQMANKK